MVVELFEVKSIKFQFKDEKGKKLNDEDVQIINPLNKTHIDYQKNIVTFEGAELNRKHNIEFKYREGYRLSQSNVFLPVSCSDMVALSFEKYTKTETPVDEKKWIKYTAISLLCFTFLTFIFLYDVIPVKGIVKSIVNIVKNMSQDGNLEDGKSVDGNPVDGNPDDGKPGDGKPGDGKPGDGKPVDGKPLDGKPVDGKPVDGKPVDGKPVDGKPVDGKALDGKPVDSKAVDGKALDGKPEDGKPDADKPGSGKPSAAGAGKAAAEASNVNDNDKSGDNLSSADKEIKNNENGYTMNDFNNDILTFQLKDIKVKIENVKNNKLQKDMKEKLDKINKISGFWNKDKRGRKKDLNK